MLLILDVSLILILLSSLDISFPSMSFTIPHAPCYYFLSPMLISSGVEFLGLFLR